MTRSDLKSFRVLVPSNSKEKFDKELIAAFENSVAAVVDNTTGKPLTSEQVIQLIPGII